MKRLDISYAMRIASEHLSYRSLIEDIEIDLERFRRAENPSTERLLELLESFQSQLRTHFALEEKGGLFDIYQEHDSNFRLQATVLLEQHRELFKRMRRILGIARTIGRPEGPEFEQCSRDLGELFCALRNHEQAEDALLDRLVDLDIRS